MEGSSTLFKILDEQRAIRALQLRESLQQEIAELQCRLSAEPSNSSLYIKLARLYPDRQELRHAVAVLEEGLARCEPDLALYREAVSTFARGNRASEALALLHRARQLFPEVGHLQLWEALFLPVLYDTQDEIEYYRQRFSKGLDASINNFPSTTLEERRGALDAVSQHLNFYLGYQGRDDRELQERYGHFVHRVVAASYPQWVRPRPMPAVPAGGRIRIGYISAHFRDHSITKLFLGWLQERNRQDFEVFAYHNSGTVDRITEKTRSLSDHFRHIQGNAKNVCQAVIADNLHVAVYLDVRHRRMAMMAALRLAPVQCVAWAHPITSGSPMIDYYLSNELMEPKNGQEHYGEKLIRLPGIGVCFPKPVIPRPLLRKSRCDFGLGEDRIIFLCCQTTFKYLPQHDDIFVQIARRVPNAQFVFLGLNDMVGDCLRSRLRRAFQTAGLDSSEYCIVLPFLNEFDYWNLNIISDVFLDTLEWSGGVTTLEAIACGLPIVTLPRAFMRGRHSYGILRQLGITETIARDKKEFVEIAVRLGTDREWRAKILEEMKANQARLYSDTKCVRALEDFFRSVVV